MKTILIALISLNLIACATTQKSYQWVVDPRTDNIEYKQQPDVLKSNWKECQDFAYRSKVAGSRYTESDIHLSCLERRGYKLQEIVGK